MITQRSYFNSPELASLVSVVSAQNDLAKLEQNQTLEFRFCHRTKVKR